MMKPVRMLQETCYFKVIKQGEIPKKEETMGEEQNGNENKNAFEEYYMPCLETDKGAIKKNFNDIPKDQIVLRKLNLVRDHYQKLSLKIPHRLTLKKV